MRLVLGLSLAAGRLPVAVVNLAYVAGDCTPTEQQVFRLTNGTLLRGSHGVDYATVHPATAKRGLTLGITATWKVWWTDAYEWNGSRFALANRRHPNLYRLEDWSASRSDVRRSYPVWLGYATTLLIHGRSHAALLALREAERDCRMAVRYAQHNPASDFYTAGFHGDDRVNLAEIRQRIRWLRNGDCDHALLYRPYDWDLQVPPYRLGRARTVQEKRGDF